MENLDNCPDADLLKRAVNGDEAAFLALYGKRKDGVFRYAYYMTNSKAAAEEVSQEVFVALLKSGESYRADRGDLGAFAFGIARNFVRRIERREYPYLPFPGGEDSVDSENHFAFRTDSLSGELIRTELVERVQSAVASLPDHYRQVVVLCDLCELSYEEAARRLRCAVRTVRSRLNRAHSLLVRKLQPLKGKQSDVGATGTEGCLI